MREAYGEKEPVKVYDGRIQSSRVGSREVPGVGQAENKQDAYQSLYQRLVFRKQRKYLMEICLCIMKVNCRRSAAVCIHLKLSQSLHGRNSACEMLVISVLMLKN